MLAAPLAVVTTAVPAHASPVDIQILATNDFHGRLLPNTSFGAQEAGAAQLAGAVKELESDYPGSTVFTAAGDLIGASTFESFIQRDKPTIDALNIAGLDVSAAGNHEFDAGYADLIERVMAPYDATTNPEGGAEWQYIAANVRDAAAPAEYALPDVTANTPDPADVSDGGTWMTTMNGVDVGFVGAVTEDLPSLVSPAGITEIDVTDIVDEVNAGADALKADGADIVVMLVHEGATTTNISSLSDGSAFAQIVNGVDGDVSAIVSGHTHLAYNHLYEGRPVVSAGQYGTNLNKLVFSVDPVAGTVALVSQDVVQANTVTVEDTDAVAAKDEAAAVVADAVAQADVLGAQELGELSGPLNRAKLANGNENRGGESTLGNFVAEVHRWATGPESSGPAQIAFMNPGGLRTDMIGDASGGYPAPLTYKQAAVVQPFANTLVTMDMTGAQIKTLLEQQWQRDRDGDVPSRPFLRLGTSEGFRFTYDKTRPEGDRITGMWLDDSRLQAGTTYTVSANSFLAAGGDNFRAFNLATNKRDSGRVDLAAMVDYMAANSPVSADPTQHAVGVTLDQDTYAPGANGTANLSSLAFSADADLKDTEVEVFFDGDSQGSFPVDNTLANVADDEYGTASVTFEIPEGAWLGRHTLTFVGDQTGTTAAADVRVEKVAPTLTATVNPDTVKVKKDVSTVSLTVSKPSGTPTGAVIATVDGKVVGAGELQAGKVDLALQPFDEVGTATVTLKYFGDDTTKAGQTTVAVTVTRGNPRSVVRGPKSVERGDKAVLRVALTAPGHTPTGKVLVKVAGKKITKRLENGKVVFRVKMTRLGKNKVVVKYRGDDLTRAKKKVIRVRVTR